MLDKIKFYWENEKLPFLCIIAFVLFILISLCGYGEALLYGIFASIIYFWNSSIPGWLVLFIVGFRVVRGLSRKLDSVIYARGKMLTSSSLSLDLDDTYLVLKKIFELRVWEVKYAYKHMRNYQKIAMHRKKSSKRNWIKVFLEEKLNEKAPRVFDKYYSSDIYWHFPEPYADTLIKIALYEINYSSDSMLEVLSELGEFGVLPLSINKLVQQYYCLCKQLPEDSRALFDKHSTVKQVCNQRDAIDALWRRFCWKFSKHIQIMQEKYPEKSEEFERQLEIIHAVETLEFNFDDEIRRPHLGKKDGSLEQIQKYENIIDTLEHI